MTAVPIPVTGGTVIFASFNSDHGTNLADGLRTHCGWAKSNTAFTSFSSFDSFFTPLPTPVTSTGVAVRRCLGDTYAAPTGQTNQAFMVAVDQLVDGSRETVLYGSTNGGTSFASAVTISNGASTGDVDGPKVAADTTNHALYVWWHNGEGTDPQNHFLRKATISSTGAVSLGPIKTLTGLTGDVAAPLHASIAIKPGPIGGRPRIFLAYPSAGMTPADCTATAPPTVAISVSWTLAVSDDEGDSWQSFPVDSDNNWPRCQFVSPSNPLFQLGDNRSYISVAYDATSDRAILVYQRHVDDANGSYVGTRVITAEWPNDPGVRDSTDGLLSATLPSVRHRAIASWRGVYR